MSRPIAPSHDAAMDFIFRAATVTTLSYEEAVAVYLRARGILSDGAEQLGAPVPPEWQPSPTPPAAPGGHIDPSWEQSVP